MICCYFHKILRNISLLFAAAKFLLSKKQVFFLYGLFPYAFFLHTAPKKAKKRSLGAIARASYHPLFYINL
jgi:hypothetical protein